METKEILSICIPTFNRIDKLLYLLSIIKEEIKGLENDIEVLVSDNHSEPFQLQKLIEYSKENSFFKLHLQKENVGLIGNYTYLAQKAAGKYTWIFGDDDVIAKGALRHIIEILKKNKGRIGLLHLSYNRYIDSVHNTFPSIKEYGGIYGFVPDIEEYFRLFSKKGLLGRLLFISANILNSEKLKSIIISKEKRTLTDPIYYPLICSKSGFYIDNQITLSQNCTKNSTSWKDEEKEVFLYYVHMTVMSVPDSYLPYKLKKELIFNAYQDLYITLFFLLPGMTSKQSLAFFKSTFTLSERLRIYMACISYIARKIYEKSRV